MRVIKMRIMRGNFFWEKSGNWYKLVNYVILTKNINEIGLKSIEEIEDYDSYRCFYCNSRLDVNYVRFVRALKERGMLPLDFKCECCICYTMNRKLEEKVDYWSDNKND